MADVFISYSHKDRERVPPIVEGLRVLGLSVWYDPHLKAGKSYDDQIKDQLVDASCLIVCWSPHSLESDYVRSEAIFARDQDILVPCIIENCSPFPPFNIIQTPNIAGWNGDGSHEAWRNLIDSIAPLVERPGLLPLLDAKTSGDPMRMAIWAKQYPTDPVANSTMDSWKAQEEQSFKARIAEVRGDIDAYFREQQARTKSRFSKMEKEFNAWVAAGSVADPDKRPNPRQVLSDIIGRASDEPALRDALSAAEAKASDADAALQRIAAEHAALTEKLRTAPATTKSSPLVLAGVAAVCLAGGFFGNQALVDPGQLAQQKITAEIDRAKMAIARAETAEKKVATLEGGLDVAQRQVQTLQNEATSNVQKVAIAEAQAKAAEQARMDASRKLDEAQRTFAMTPSPPSPAAPAPIPQVASSPAATTSTTSGSSGNFSQNMENCTHGAGSRFDTDNAAKDGPNDMATLTLEAIRATISTCRAASQQASDQRMKRRAFAQLGRAQAALAVRLGQSNIEADAKQAMQIAYSSWSTAAGMGSAFAMNQIGAYYDGSFSREVNRADSNYFVLRDQKEAITHWRNAANGGNPPAMTNMAAMMLDPRTTLVNFDAQQADQYLEASMRLGHPRAYIVKASGVLNGHLEPFLRTDSSKRQRAAQLAERAACAGDRAGADAFFTVDFRYMAAYKPAQYVC